VITKSIHCLSITVVVCPEQEKAQQNSIWTEALKGIAKEGGEQREVRRMFKMLREV